MTELILESEIERSARVKQVEGMFDLDAAEHAETRIHGLSLGDLDAQEWKIGLIAGPSGAGKSSVARATFGDLVIEDHKWSSERALIDDFPSGVKKTTNLLSSVGLSSPPVWVRPYQTLSTGEKFRADLARAFAESEDGTIVFDEFTSVVDRTVAQIGSAAVAKMIRRSESNQRLVAVTCHFDVLEWLQPDWVYEPHTGTLTWRSVQPRPRINVEIREERVEDIWPVFRRHHYLSGDHNISARCVAAYVDGSPAAMISVLALPSGTIKNSFRVHRVVTSPDYQGVGIGKMLLDVVGGAYRSQRRRLYIATSHPGLIRGLDASRTWSTRRNMKRNTANTIAALNKTASLARPTSSFMYVGPEDDRLVGMLHR